MSEDLLDDNQNESGKLPQMLNVLTILTFIGSGYALLTNIWSYFTHASNVEKLNEQLAEMDSRESTGNSTIDGMMDGVAEGIQRIIENGPTLYIIAIVIALLCIFAAYQMRNLKKTGYYLYIAACILGLVIPIIIVGGGIIGGVMGILGGLVSVTFIILYGVNLKHMR